MPCASAGACLLCAIDVQEKAKLAAEGEEEERPTSEVWELQLDGDRHMGLD